MVTITISGAEKSGGRRERVDSHIRSHSVFILKPHSGVKGTEQ